MQGDTGAVRQGQQLVRVMLQPLPQGGTGIGVSQNLGKKSAADGIRQISPAAGQQTVLIQAGAQPVRSYGAGSMPLARSSSASAGRVMHSASSKSPRSRRERLPVRVSYCL